MWVRLHFHLNFILVKILCNDRCWRKNVIFFFLSILSCIYIFFYRNAWIPTHLGSVTNLFSFMHSDTCLAVPYEYNIALFISYMYCMYTYMCARVPNSSYLCLPFCSFHTEYACIWGNTACMVLAVQVLKHGMLNTMKSKIKRSLASLVPRWESQSLLPNTTDVPAGHPNDLSL